MATLALGDGAAALAAGLWAGRAAPLGHARPWHGRTARTQPLRSPASLPPAQDSSSDQMSGERSLRAIAQEVYSQPSAHPVEAIQNNVGA